TEQRVRPATRLDAPTHARVLAEEVKRTMRVPYGLRHVEAARFETLLPLAADPAVGDIALAQVEKIGKNTKLELANGRACALHVGDLLAVVFGNRYATMQFEGYARSNGEVCDLLSMGGLCGLVESRHASVPEASKLRLLGAIGDRAGKALTLPSFSLPPPKRAARDMKVVVVCGSSMDAGKTFSASSIISGLRKLGGAVAGIKLTGTAAGRDTWSMLDAGASPALDFVDGGYPSTYRLDLDPLLDLHAHLLGHAAEQGASWAVVEIADGLLQAETALLLRSRAFTKTVDGWVFAAADPLAALGGIDLLRTWGIHPVGVTGRITMSPLGMREATAATGLPCFTAADLQDGAINPLLIAGSDTVDRTVRASFG
ncbi:MAG TPA: hypothetical protein VFH73_24400, partial [Polyangia bacterium]|nr:hypothetical protein [Polyangia bacterium]